MQHQDERPDHLITPERAAKGDVEYSVNGRGHIDRAQVTGGTWLYWLRDNRIIDNFDVANGEWFRNMHDAYSNRQGIRTSGSHRDGDTESSLADDYVKLVIIIRAAVFRDIETCCTEALNPRRVQMMWLSRGRWSSAFSRLDSALGDLRERKKVLAPSDNPC